MCWVQHGGQGFQSSRAAMYSTCQALQLPLLIFTLFIVPGLFEALYSFGLKVMGNFEGVGGWAGFKDISLSISLQA